MCCGLLAVLATLTPIDLSDYPAFSNDMLPSFANDMSIGPLDPEYLQFLDNIEQPKATTTGLEWVTAKGIAKVGTGPSAGSGLETGGGRGGSTGRARTGTVDPTDRNQSSQVDARQSPTVDCSHLSTLILEEMNPQTINLVVNTLLSSNSRFPMRLDNNC